MSSPHKQPPARVPTLTEVVALDAAMPGVQSVPGSGTGGAQDLAERMAEDLRPWVDSMFEQRLREASRLGIGHAIVPPLGGSIPKLGGMALHEVRRVTQAINSL